MSRILVVDNDPAARRVFKAIVASAGHEVEEAENGLIALEMIPLQPPDVIILDVLMPVMNGREMFLRLKNEGKRPPVIVLSAYDAERERRDMGAEAALDKPFTPEDLLEIIEQLLREYPSEPPDVHHQTLTSQNLHMRYW